MIDPNLITTIRAGELPPASLSLTDVIVHEVGTDLKKATIQELIDFITPFVNAIQFQVISLHVNSAYIAANFDVTGLGINLMTGYAICNGNNGTVNKDGRVGIAYGATHSTMLQTGGSKDAVVVAHSHTTDLGFESFQAGGNTNAASSLQPTPSNPGVRFRTTSTVGVSGTDKNMQPYIVELHVMKL